MSYREHEDLFIFETGRRSYKPPEAFVYILKMSETQLAWVLMLEDCTVHSFSKRHCHLVNDCVVVPNWLARRMGL